MFDTFTTETLAGALAANEEDLATVLDHGADLKAAGLNPIVHQSVRDLEDAACAIVSGVEIYLAIHTRFSS